MSLGIIFWILMLVWLVFGWSATRQDAAGTKLGVWAPLGSTLLLFVLLLILGWGQFGAPVHA